MVGPLGFSLLKERKKESGEKRLSCGAASSTSSTCGDAVVESPSMSPANVGII